MPLWVLGAVATLSSSLKYKIKMIKLKEINEPYFYCWRSIFLFCFYIIIILVKFYFNFKIKINIFLGVLLQKIIFNTYILEITKLSMKNHKSIFFYSFLCWIFLSYFLFFLSYTYCFNYFYNFVTFEYVESQSICSITRCLIS